MKNLITHSFVLLSIICSSAAILFAQQQPSGEMAKSYVAYLASDALEGRDTGTAGYEKATRWVAEKFKSWGLEPAGDNGTYFQNFPFQYHKDEFDYPKLTIENRTFYFEDQDFNVLRYSGGGKLKAEVVFVGYGISAAEKWLDEYAGLDVKDKIVLVMHGCPNDDEQQWAGFHSDSAKAAIAMKKGARGMLLCANLAKEERGIGEWRLSPANHRANFVAFGIDERVVKFLLKKKNETSRAFQRRLQDKIENLNKNLQPISYATGMKAEMAVKTEFDPERQGVNVLGMIKGIDPAVGDELIVLGAHLDHLGVRYGQIYNGADDNATGAAVVMEVARVMKANQLKSKRTILFACWGGEERGLLGSSYYAQHPIIPIEKTVVNLNLDMVGIGGKLNLPGIYFSPEIWQIIKENASAEVLDFVEPSRGGPGGSDHTPFIMRGVPAFALMTSPWLSHTDYHQPEDDTEKINAELLGKVAQFVYDNAVLLTNYNGNLIVENRLPLYIHKSATIINIHPIAYEQGLALMDSLQNEWIDIQFVEVALESLENPSEKLAEMVKSLDAASQEESDISRMMAPMARMFGSRNERTISVVGLKGANSVNSDPANLRIAGKLGAKFFMFNSVDGKWIDNEGLTKEGKKTIRELNDQKMLILTQNLPENAIIQILDASKHPVIVAGVKTVASISDSLIQKVEKNGGIFALAYCPDKIDRLVERIEALKQRTKVTQIGLYPCPEQELDIPNLDQLLNLTIALNQKGCSDAEIKNILGQNFQTVLDKVNPSERRRMRRPF